MEVAANRRATLVLRRNDAGAVVAEGPSTAFFGHRYSGQRAGTWVEWDWNGEVLKVRNGRYGYYPLFFFATPAAVGVSSHLLDLAVDVEDRELDDDGLAVFLRLGYYIGDDTPFRAIRVMPPASVLTWIDGRLTVDASPPVCSTVDAVGRVACMDEFTERFGRAVERLAPDADGGRSILPLSGGRDSRHIGLAMSRRGVAPARAVSVRYAPPGNPADAEVGARVARRLAVPHDVLAAPDFTFTGERRKNRLTHYCVREHQWLLPLRDYLAGVQAERLYDGAAGDHLSGGSASLTVQRDTLYRAGRLHELAEDLLGDDGYLPTMLSPPALHRWSRDRAIGRLVRELDRYQDRPNPFSQFMFWNRVRRGLALSPWAILNGHTTPVAPFLDPIVYDLLSGVPSAMFLDHTFHTQAIARRYPRSASIPYAPKPQRPVPVTRSTGARQLADLIMALRWPPWNRWWNPGGLLPRILASPVKVPLAVGLRGTLSNLLYLDDLARIAGTETPARIP